VNANAWAAVAVLLAAGLVTDIGILVIFLPVLRRVDRILDHLDQIQSDLEQMLDQSSYHLD
jgi:UPF0716 family protein affecting phage T7 exclusion